MGRRQVAGDQRGRAPLRIAYRDPARRQRCGAQYCRLALTMSMALRAAVRTCSRHDCLGCPGPGSRRLRRHSPGPGTRPGSARRVRHGWGRRPTAHSDPRCPGCHVPRHHRPPARRRCAGGQVQQASAFGQLAAVVRGAIVQLVRLGGPGRHPGRAIGSADSRSPGASRAAAAGARVSASRALARRQNRKRKLQGRVGMGAP